MSYMGITRWQLEKYTPLSPGVSEGRSSQQLRSENGRDLEFEFSSAEKAIRVYHRGRCVEEHSLLTAGSTNLSARARGGDICLTIPGNYNNQRTPSQRFRVKFSQSRGRSAVDSRKDCCDLLRHFMTVTENENKENSSSQRSTHSNSSSFADEHNRHSAVKQRRLSDDTFSQPLFVDTSRNSFHSPVVAGLAPLERKSTSFLPCATSSQNDQRVPQITHRISSSQSDVGSGFGSPQNRSFRAENLSLFVEEPGGRKVDDSMMTSSQRERISSLNWNIHEQSSSQQLYSSSQDIHGLFSSQRSAVISSSSQTLNFTKDTGTQTTAVDYENEEFLSELVRYSIGDPNFPKFVQKVEIELDKVLKMKNIKQ